MTWAASLQKAKIMKAEVANLRAEIHRLSHRDALKRAERAIRTRSPGGVRVEYLLRSLPRVGDLKLQRILGEAGITKHGMRLRELTPYRAERLIAAMYGEDWNGPRI